MQQQHDRLVSGLSAVEGFILSYAPGAQNVYTSTSMTDPNGAAKKMVCHGSHQYTPFVLAYIPAVILMETSHVDRPHIGWIKSKRY